MIILETVRLVVREQEEPDLDAIDSFQSDIEVMKYVGEGKTISRETTEKSIKYWQKYGEERGYSSWAVIEKETGNLIGKAGLAELPDKTEIEVFYMFGREAWGKGYATEVCRALIVYGKQTLKLNRIAAFTYPENKPSQKVLLKCGMVPNGTKVSNNITFLFFKTP